jgi:hypothetical protein
LIFWYCSINGVDMGFHHKWYRSINGVDMGFHH